MIGIVTNVLTNQEDLLWPFLDLYIYVVLNVSRK